MSEDNGTKLSETELLKLQNLRLKVNALDNRLEAMKQRQNAIMIELQVIPGKLKEAEQEREQLADAFNSAYTTAKETAEVPEGMELNLETGEAVDPKQAQQ